MPRHISLQPHLPNDDLEVCYRGCRDPVERSHWHFLWLLARGMTATAVASLTGYSAYSGSRHHISQSYGSQSSYTSSSKAFVSKYDRAC